MVERNVKVFGRVMVQRSEATGLWVWIETMECLCVCEVPRGLDLADVPPELHADVQTAYDWATEQNNTPAEHDVSRAELHDEWLHEWRHGIGV